MNYLVVNGNGEITFKPKLVVKGTRLHCLLAFEIALVNSKAKQFNKIDR